MSKYVGVTNRREDGTVRVNAERSREIVHASPVAMLVARVPDETMEIVNDKFTKLFGYTAEDIPGVSYWWPLAYPDKRYRSEMQTAWKRRIEKALRNSGDIEPMEARIRCKDGTLRDVELHLSILDDAFLVSFIDVTARKMAEQALRASEERFRLAAEAGHMYAYEWDIATNLLIRSQQCTSVMGPGAILLAPLQDITASIHPGDLGHISAAIAGLRPDRPNDRVAYRSKRTDGSEIWLEQSFRGYFNKSGELTNLVGMVVDITSRKEAENSLKTLSGRLIEAQEQERRRIARELHDDINQRLAILNIEFQRLADDPPRDRAVLRKRIEELGARSSEISSEVSALTQELHSPKLELLGIVAAMRSFCDDFRKIHKLSVHFRESCVPRDLSRAVSLCLFRIFQESLNNAAKHSGATEVDAELTGSADEILLRIRDQGRGFDAGLRGERRGPGSAQHAGTRQALEGRHLD